MRFVTILLDCLRPMIGPIGTLVEIAPSEMLGAVLARLEPERYVRIDIGYDKRIVDVTGSLTRLPLADSSVDFLMCFHVLEHIPDDRTAMAEIARVLAPGGVGLLQVPWRPGTRTDEEYGLSAEENTLRFGQRDHVRFYGDDFEDRLVAAGLSLTRIGALDLLGAKMSDYLKLEANPPIWLVRRSDSPHPPAGLAAPVPTSLTRTLDALLDQLTDKHEALVRTRERNAVLQAKVQELRRQPLPAKRGLATRVVGRMRRLVRRS
jgi:SAM-dependent methyltransferase